MQNKNIIFFDGVCELCDWFVNFVFKRDSKKQFLYAPLQGETAQNYLKKEDILGFKSIIFYHQGKILKESPALKAIMKKLYPRWAFLLAILPNLIFNLFYRFIAKRRYAFLEKKKASTKLKRNKKNIS